MQRALRQTLPALTFVLSACAASGGTAERGAVPAEAGVSAEPGAAMEHQHGEADAAVGPGYTAADVRFMQDMIGHHEQALLMTAMAPGRDAREMVLRLVQKIDISQRDEIALMKAWLTERNQPLPDEHHMHGMLMPGMLTDSQLAQLRAARGPEFERLFLTLMIQHHEGALHMVDMLFETPGAAQDSDIFRFVTDVVTDQSDEIDIMMHMLELLAANRGSETR
ncbi:MAG: DUF305 domain-containing protein [Gemmatimonadetes bacterium]|nr:DUF305 domain-containing protein [Gemmatimonadota bacterium]